VPKASLDGVTLAESDHTAVVEGNHYFPPESVNGERFGESATRTICSWKGEAGYYGIEVDGASVGDAAWYHPEPMEAARDIENHVAFYGNKVRVEV
jgi:uncharacterized protein (DUF427 family)